MKITRILAMMMTAALAAGVTSCKDDPEPDPPGELEVNLRGIVNPFTRVSTDGSQWNADDAVGVFMTANGQELAASSIVGGGNNLKYTAGADGTSASALVAAGNKLYFPENGDKVDFIAYYPYSAALDNFTIAVDITDQSDQASLDLMYAKETGKDKESGRVDLSFKHVMSKLNFAFVAGEGLETSDLAGLTLAITGIDRTRTIDLNDGSVTGLGSSGSLTVPTTADGLSGEAMVIPQELTEGKLIVTRQGAEPFESPFNYELVSGKVQSYSITVTERGIEMEPIELLSDGIENWETTSTINGDTKFRYAIGDYYPDPNVVYDPSNPGEVLSGEPAIGIVYWLDDDDEDFLNGKGLVGKIVGFVENEGVQWDGDATWMTLESDDDGLAVTAQIMEEILYWLNNEATRWPLYQWMHKMNPSEGKWEQYKDRNNKLWFIPAKLELQGVYDLWISMGSDLDDKIEAAGGVPFSPEKYWTGTNTDSDISVTLDFSDGSFEELSKKDSYRGRPIMRFPYLD